LGVKNTSYLRSLIFGLTFAAAWTPCIGPILGILLTLTAKTGSALQGSILLAFYSIGIGIWFLLFAIFMNTFQRFFKKIMPYAEKIMLFFGIIVCILGVLIFTNNFVIINQFFAQVGFLDQAINLELNLSNNVESIYGPLVAFTAGILSFFSPCVLPLVPVFFINICGDIMNNQKTNGDISIISHSLVFILGFSIVFVALGTTAGFLGSFLVDNIKIINQVSGVVIFIFGLQMAGIIKIPFLNRTYQIS
jgi:cytochrome c biogenesis protein CcdA|tara:strand:+ start:2830 stop:3576 length:747 start_codon:yes stop_codon:yes gene_type:complete